MPAWLEADRLAELRGYDVLDTDSQAVFDDFVRIAAHVCDAPIALVSLVDEGRQWFAAETGIGIRETPRSVSVCAHAIQQSDLFIIPDLSADDRFENNPFVTGNPNLRFYGGAILETAAGLPLGTMCVLDYTARPNGLTEHQKFTLKALARQVMAQLELRRALQAREAAEIAKNAIIDEMEILLAEKNAALDEKELLVQEVHHRVKNSLAMVQSLLLMQARAMADDDAAQRLRESAGRIHAFGVMHEHLYRIGAAAQVDVAAYLRSLLGDLSATLVERAIRFDGESEPWPSAEAPTLGLIAVELVTNAIKYGAGTITVTLDHVDGEAILIVEDEGHDLPKDFQPSASRGFGMRIVTGLLQSRQGRLEIDRSRLRTCFVASLRVPAIHDQ